MTASPVESIYDEDARIAELKNAIRGISFRYRNESGDLTIAVGTVERAIYFEGGTVGQVDVKVGPGTLLQAFNLRIGPDHALFSYKLVPELKSLVLPLKDQPEPPFRGLPLPMPLVYTPVSARDIQQSHSADDVIRLIDLILSLEEDPRWFEQSET